MLKRKESAWRQVLLVWRAPCLAKKAKKAAVAAVAFSRTRTLTENLCFRG